ncbi:hypothetical protein BJY52DRAFT_1220611 [Lactarius psammicola]|nr:hypothetical protein BJY52DRAFT_1220611 [Lactarius psammicola]
MSTYHTGFGNGFDCSSLGDLGFHASENQGQRQFNGLGNAVGAIQSAFGPQAVQNTDVILGIVAGASEATLERNAFYVGLKTVASNRATEIEALKGTIEQKTQEIVGRDKEIDILKARCETLEGTIDRFAKDYHTLKGAGSNEGQITFMTDLGPMPTPWKRNEHPDVTIWMKREFALAAAKARKGETSGDPSDVAKTKAKVGRPSKKDQEGHKYIYLQGRDGIPISVETLGKMSVKARSIWDFLLTKGKAPPQFGKMPWDAWDLYARAMLTDPEFDFLLLCDDATWKLREWSTQNYSGWAGNRGIRPKNIGQNAGKNEDALDDPALIRMKSSDGTDDSNDSIQLADHVLDSDDNRTEETIPEPEAAGFPESDDNPEENPGPSTQSVRSVLGTIGSANTHSKPQGPIVHEENPGPSTQSVRSVLDTIGSANTHSKPQGPIVHEENPGPSTQSPQGPTVPEENPGPSTQSSRGPVQSVIANPFAPTASSSSPGTHTGVTKTNPSPATPLSSGPSTSPSIAQHPPAKSTIAQEIQDPVAPLVTSEPKQTPTAGPSDSQSPIPVHPDPAHANAAIPNLRFERAMANAEKKRKAEGKTAAAPSKKLKAANALAEPTGTITIKNICMRQWNEQQPGGQGLAANFDVYFKGLSDADKEPFKREMRIAQGAARKAKTAAKKSGEVPSVN